MRLIDADSLMEKVNSDGAYGYVDAKQISEAPTVDAVLVVRCRECKYRGTDDCIFHIKGEPADEELLLKLDNDFCSYGERKEGADNEPYYCKNENMADCRKCYWRNICIRHNPFECNHFKKEYGD